MRIYNSDGEDHEYHAIRSFFPEKYAEQNRNDPQAKNVLNYDIYRNR